MLYQALRDSVAKIDVNLILRHVPFLGERESDDPEASMSSTERAHALKHAETLQQGIPLNHNTSTLIQNL